MPYAGELIGPCLEPLATVWNTLQREQSEKDEVWAYDEILDMFMLGSKWLFLLVKWKPTDGTEHPHSWEPISSFDVKRSLKGGIKLAKLSYSTGLLRRAVLWAFALQCGSLKLNKKSYEGMQIYLAIIIASGYPPCQDYGHAIDLSKTGAMEAWKAAQVLTTREDRPVLNGWKSVITAGSDGNPPLFDNWSDDFRKLKTVIDRAIEHNDSGIVATEKDMSAVSFQPSPGAQPDRADEDAREDQINPLEAAAVNTLSTGLERSVVEAAVNRASQVENTPVVEAAVNRASQLEGSPAVEAAVIRARRVENGRRGPVLRLEGQFSSPEPAASVSAVIPAAVSAVIPASDPEVVPVRVSEVTPSAAVSAVIPAADPEVVPAPSPEVTPAAPVSAVVPVRVSEVTPSAAVSAVVPAPSPEVAPSAAVSAVVPSAAVSAVVPAPSAEVTPSAAVSAVVPAPSAEVTPSASVSAVSSVPAFTVAPGDIVDILSRIRQIINRQDVTLDQIRGVVNEDINMGISIVNVMFKRPRLG